MKDLIEEATKEHMECYEGTCLETGTQVKGYYYFTIDKIPYIVAKDMTQWAAHNAVICKGRIIGYAIQCRVGSVTLTVNK